MEIEVGCYARAILDFDTNVSGELPLTIGDVVRVDKQIDQNWYFTKNDFCTFIVPWKNNNFFFTFRIRNLSKRLIISICNLIFLTFLTL